MVGLFGSAISGDGDDWREGEGESDDWSGGVKNGEGFDIGGTGQGGVMAVGGMSGTVEVVWQSLRALFTSRRMASGSGKVGASDRLND